MKFSKTAKKVSIFIFTGILLIEFLSLLFLKNINKISVQSQADNKKEQNTPTASQEKQDKPPAQNTIVQKVEAKPAGFCLRVPVIFYHHIEPIAQAKSEGHVQLTVDANIFDAQMKYLEDHGYRSITAEELANAVINHNNLGKAVVVTVDDAYADAYNFAFPIAKKYRIILNLMVPTGLLNNPGYLNWDQLREMVNSGLAQAYDHTWSHFSLPKGDEAKIQMEIMTAKNQLEQNLGRTVRILAYPYGTGDQLVINILQKDGFIAAFSTIPSFYQCDSYIFNLRRNRIGNASLSAYGL